jgi:hypothetical protein
VATGIWLAIPAEMENYKNYLSISFFFNQNVVVAVPPSQFVPRRWLLARVAPNRPFCCAAGFWPWLLQRWQLLTAAAAVASAVVWPNVAAVVVVAEVDGSF